MSDPHFDSSSSLSDGLWGTFKDKISSALAHLLVISDVWRVSNAQSISFWVAFVEANYAERLMVVRNSTADALVPMPVGFRFCTQPFSRLLVSCDRTFQLNRPLCWILQFFRNNEQDYAMKEVMLALISLTLKNI